jgi:hypothetical protein
MKPSVICAAILTGLMCAAAAPAADGSQPLGDPVLERPTLHSLGMYWIVSGDDNRNATVRLEYRAAGAPDWRPGMPLVRVERNAHLMEKNGSRLKVPDDGWLFAGSALLLTPDTAYELKVTLDYPDGTTVTKVLLARTRAEPRVAPSAPRRHVVPGAGGGTGTAADPFRGLATAHQAAAPGDVMLLHAGVYDGPWTITRSGAPGKPIVWRGAGDGETVIDGQGKADKRPGFAVSASDTHDVWFENLTVRNARHGVVFQDAARIVVRRCHVHNVEFGLTATRDRRGTADDHFLSDNVIEGPSTWPRTKGIEDARGIQVTGQGHVVCYNRVRGFGDAIDTFPSGRCSAIDFHNNDVSELTDDGFEMDYSERNTRCFHNRLTNVFQGISLQPVYGGPVYVFRNVMYNVGLEPFKLHNSPSGGLILHNTIVKKGTPELLWTSARVRHCVTRNNLFVGTAADYAYDCTAPMVNCDFDYDGFAGGPFRSFLRWNRARYATPDEVRQRAPVLRHAVLVGEASPFASGAVPPADVAKQVETPVDLRLAPGSAAVDAGQVLPGLNDRFKGRGPDLGAYELGDPLPHYGPRPAPDPARE